MTCDETRDALLSADGPDRSTADHLAGCAACASFASEITQLEQRYRSLPLAPEADAARIAFLSRMPIARPRPWWSPPRWIAAAAVLTVVGLSLFFLAPTPEAQASPALIERLVDWNLELSQASTPAERGQIFATQQAALKHEVERAPLPAAERELAQTLLDNGTWLAAHDDPVATAERFSGLADQLMERMQTASERRDMKAANRFAHLQNLVAEQGVAGHFQKAQASGALDFENRRRLENLILRDEGRMKKLVELLERNPDISRKELRKALDIQPKNPKATARKKP